MAKAQRLSEEDRRFFQHLAQVIFSNPFSVKQELVEELLGKTLSTAAPGDEHKYLWLVPLLEERLDKLQSRGITTIHCVNSKDKEVLEHAYLFQIFHRFVDDFDALIQTQLSQGDKPAAVPFHRDLIDALLARGFSEQEVLRYAALFYQLRRAFYFIARALVGESSAMVKLRHALWNNVFTSDVRLYAKHLWNRMEDFSTLLLGETGTGKGTAAAAIGRSGLIPFDEKTCRFKLSFTETFVAINLSEFPESLIESELFGHRKGAFTGAIDNHKGLFERCSAHGSLFIDEIGEISEPVQIKLLNVLQERRFAPVGSHEVRRFEGRVIAATNRSIAMLRRQGKFRDDFYFRLSSDVIDVPPLRLRLRQSPQELEQLAALLITRMLGECSDTVLRQVLDALTSSLAPDYAWPGNVRELEQTVRRIIINGAYVGGAPLEDHQPEWLIQLQQGRLSAQELLANYCRLLYQLHGSYEEAATRAGLDRRTVKKYIDSGAGADL